MQNLCFCCSEPDVQIYKGRSKSFDADLRWKGKAVHCKSQSVESAELYGASWSFQWGSAQGTAQGHQDKLFNKSPEERAEELCAFCLVEEDPTQKTAQVEIKCICTLDTLFLKELFGLPRLAHLRDVKRVVYLEKLEEKGVQSLLK